MTPVGRACTGPAFLQGSNSGCGQFQGSSLTQHAYLNPRSTHICTLHSRWFKKHVGVLRLCFCHVLQAVVCGEVTMFGLSFLLSSPESPFHPESDRDLVAHEGHSSSR